MPTFEHTVEIDAPIDRVFAFSIDPGNWRRTTPGLTDLEVVEETADGLRMNATYRMLGISMEGEMELSYVEPTEHTVTFDSPGLTGELEYQYSENDTGTTVVQRADYEFGDSLLERVVRPVAKRYNKRQFKQSLETTKDLVEAEAKATA